MTPTPAHGLRRHRRWAAALGVAALLGLAGCGASDDMAGSTAAEPQPAAGGVAPAAKDESNYSLQDSGGGRDAAGSASPVVVATTGPRQVIRTAELTVEVDDLDDAARRARAVAPSLGGVVASEKSDRPGREESDDDGGTSVIELRVPSARLDEAIGRLAELGTERGRAVTSEDVTAQIADLDGRLATQRAALDRVRQLLARAGSIKDVLALEADLTQREADLEGLQQRLAALRGQADLSSLTVTLVTEGSPAAEEPRTGFVGGLEAGWESLADTAVVVSAVVGALLPWAVPIGLVVAGVVVLRRRRRGTAAAPPPAPAPVPAPPAAPRPEGAPPAAPPA